MKRIFQAVLLFLLSSNQLFATHNRAGEITLTQLDELTYEITITTFTYTLSQADRSQLEVQWGDNTFSYAQRKSITKLPNFYQKNTYITQHTFPGAGTYEIVVQDPNRNLGVKNIPNSVNVVFSIKTTITINPTVGKNSTPILLNPPIDRAALNQIFIHNPAAYDPDGDSISYKLTVCTEEDGKPIENYTLPQSSDTLYVDPITGDLTWITPVDTGIYNIAIDIEEWRDGVKIGNIVRDMQIEVYDTDNHPPEQNELPSYCIEAGELIEFDVIATDIDNDSLRQSASGGPFVVNESPASYTINSELVDIGYSEATFRWATNCRHVRQQPYTVIFKAEDNNQETNLVDIKNVNIKIIGPAPDRPTLIPASNSITVVWNADNCPNVVGYEIYRKDGPAAYLPDSCTNGIPPSTGYEKIGSTSARSDTIYTDMGSGNGLEQGVEYCYAVVAIYPDGTRSYPSPEACSPLIAGTPSQLVVTVTDQSESGEVTLKWAHPNELDTLPGPFEYVIYRYNDFFGQELQETLSFSTANSQDTLYIDQNVNTLEWPYSYKIELYNDTPGNRFLISDPDKIELGSTMVPYLKGTDNQIEIDIVKNVPWINYDYTIYRLNEQTGVYDSIGYTTDPFYTDSALQNGKNYCYRIKSTGWRNIDGILYENTNYSHENCTMPVDSIAPCPPTLNGQSLCDSGYNHLNWYFNDPVCSADVVGYKLYYSSTISGDTSLIESFSNRNDTSYNQIPDESLTGCYYVTAIDSFSNESNASIRVCLDECTGYELPNVFSPNNDDINDTYKALRTSYVEKVDFQVFNRWGLLVYKTEDPDIKWDGKLLDSNELVSPGVYYYICEVFEYRLSGLESYTLTGFIYVYSGDENEVFFE